MTSEQPTNRQPAPSHDPVEAHQRPLSCTPALDLTRTAAAGWCRPRRCAHRRPSSGRSPAGQVQRRSRHAGPGPVTLGFRAAVDDPDQDRHHHPREPHHRDAHPYRRHQRRRRLAVLSSPWATWPASSASPPTPPGWSSRRSSPACSVSLRGDPYRWPTNAGVGRVSTPVTTTTATTRPTAVGHPAVYNDSTGTLQRCRRRHSANRGMISADMPAAPSCDVESCCPAEDGTLWALSPRL